MPRERGREKTSSDDFLTVPARVTMTMNFSGSNDRTGRKACTVSFGMKFSRLTILRPRPWAATSGML